jgi:OmcA/MtrC family decaheme c-type cytochrome
MRISCPNGLFAGPVALCALLLAAPASAQTALDWASGANYAFKIQNVQFNTTTRTVTVVFNVLKGGLPYALTNADFATNGGRLSMDVAWNAGAWGAIELVNTNSAVTSIARTWMNTNPPAAGGAGPSTAKSVNLLAASACNGGGSPCAAYPNAALTYWAATTVPPDAKGSGRVGIEGHAVNLATLAVIPIKGATMDFVMDTPVVVRRKIVDINKCKQCHDDRVHGAGVVPRLSLHGGNRTEEPELCVMCHNPNQTDAAYRSSGAEESMDFKRLIHGIHAGGFRRSPLVVIGFKGSVNDFSTVRFPASLESSCTRCHIDANGKGTFELPVASTLGSTVASGSVLSLPGSVDTSPASDLRISPTAAACSACHDSAEVKRHMIAQGASFGATQAVLAGKERCVNCHGPGKEKSVRRAHEIGSSGSNTTSGRDR